MVPQNKTLIPPFQPVGRTGFLRNPILLWIKSAKLSRLRPGMQMNQAAGSTLDDLEFPVGGCVNTIGGGEQSTRLSAAACGTGVESRWDCGNTAMPVSISGVICAQVLRKIFGNEIGLFFHNRL